MNIYVSEQIHYSRINALYSLTDSKNKILEKLSQRKNILCISIRVKKRERDIVQFAEQKSCFFLWVVDHFILGANVHESLSTINCVRGGICFKKIVSNIRLDLYYSFFTHLVCEVLIILRILSYICSVYLLFLSITSYYVLLIIKFVCCFSLLNHKSNLMKYIQHHFG